MPRSAGLISPSDDVEGNAASIAIVSDAWWRTRLGASAGRGGQHHRT